MAFRFIHTTDWHLGRLFHAVSLLDDQAHLLAQLLDSIRDCRPQALIVAGDVYDLLDPMARLREVYPNELHLDHPGLGGGGPGDPRGGGCPAYRGPRSRRHGTRRRPHHPHQSRRQRCRPAAKPARPKARTPRVAGSGTDSGTNSTQTKLGLAE